MAFAKAFFKNLQKHKYSFIHKEIPVVGNGYDVQSSDEEEVFVQETNLDTSDSKPLMNSSIKGKKSKIKTRKSNCEFSKICKTFFYILASVSVLAAVIVTIVWLMLTLGSQSQALTVPGHSVVNGKPDTTEKLIGCDKVDVEDVWVVGFPKLLTESAFRLVDINKDGVLDVIFGFATGADRFSTYSIACDIYFPGHHPCSGGVMALDGSTGKEMWRTYTEHEIYGLNCQYDIDKDGIKDCLAGGRAGVFIAVSGKNGNRLWTLKNKKAINPVMNTYTPQYIPDVDNDEVADIIVVHGGDTLQEADSLYRLSGRILIVSGRTGQILRWLGVPDQRESYYSPQILTQRDGSQVLLLGTGGETHNGSLWKIDMESLLKEKIGRAVKLFSDTHKGFMTPPVLVDITQDGVEDIIIPSFNSTLLAIDGESSKLLWSVRFPSSESYSTPAAGFYNDDNIPDFLVKYAYGSGFPVYYYSDATVLDGKTGKRLIDPALRDSIGSQSSPLTVSMEGFGNDVFLIWMAFCKGFEESTDKYSFKKNTIHALKSLADKCRQRFNTVGYSKLVAISNQFARKGFDIYNSQERIKVEHSKWVNTTAEAYEYIMKHPELRNTTHQSGSLINLILEILPKSVHQGRGRLSNKTHHISSHKIKFRKGHNFSGFQSRKNFISTIKNDSLRGHKQQPDDLYSRYNRKESNKKGYNQKSKLNGSYLPIHHRSISSEEYMYPYKDSISNKYIESPYDSYYQSEDTGYNNRGDDVYQRNYRRGYNTVTERDGHLKSTNKFMEKRITSKKRTRRHVGAHDDDGIQRLTSTGTLAPSSLPSSHADYNNTIDVIFATYWVFPLKSKFVLVDDEKCIAKKMAEEGVARTDPTSKYYNMDHDGYEEAITNDCLSLSHPHSPGSEEDALLIQENIMNMYLKMGQMTVYRLRLKFSCTKSKNLTDNSRCASVLPFNQQKWAAYMGSNGDSHWRIRDLY